MELNHLRMTYWQFMGKGGGGGDSTYKNMGDTECGTSREVALQSTICFQRQS